VGGVTERLIAPLGVTVPDSRARTSGRMSWPLGRRGGWRRVIARMSVYLFTSGPCTAERIYFALVEGGAGGGVTVRLNTWMSVAVHISGNPDILA